MWKTYILLVMIAAFAFGGLEIAVVVFAIVFLFGGKKIPQLMKGLAQGLGEFKKAKIEADKMAHELNKEIGEISTK